MYEDVTIKDFMSAWFKKDYSKLSKEDFDLCYSEYIDSTGMYVTEEFDVVAGIHYLTNRINTIKTWVSLQKQCLFILGEPFLDELEFITKYGHHVVWNNDFEDFNKQLDRIILRDSKFQIELEQKHKKLEELRSKRNIKEVTKKDEREQFLRMLNSLSKIGFKIDKNETTIEELALMLKQQFEENEKLEMKYARR
jgi:hypothetical protein